MLAFDLFSSAKNSDSQVVSLMLDNGICGTNSFEVVLTIQFYLCRYGLGLYQQDQVERLLMLVSTVLR